MKFNNFKELQDFLRAELEADIRASRDKDTYLIVIGKIALVESFYPIEQLPYWLKEARLNLNDKLKFLS